MSTKTIRFIKSIKLYPSSDFNQTVKDKIHREVGNAYNDQKSIKIEDFLSLFTIENLNYEAFTNFIGNDLNIVFTHLRLDDELEMDRKPITISLKNRDNFKFQGYWFIAFSENYELLAGDNNEFLNVIINGYEVKLSIQKLNNMRITFQTIDY